ncbi:MAG: Gfo/Idh/MocA family oxidoreductase [Candidatus Pacearchaeota archaeon]
MENIIVVGTGDVFHRFLAPALEILEFQGLLKVIATIDIKNRSALEYLSEKIEHRIRTSDENLSDLIEDMKEKNPIVILAHDNDLHYEDTKNLVENGFRVMLEKPYVVNKWQLDLFKRLISKNSNKIFLMEYYLMRKMSPLFLLSGMINKDSFYIGTGEVFREKESNSTLTSYIGKLEELLGDPIYLKIKILESRGDSGRLDHRGAHVFDIRRGGGMIQDMGIHSFIPLFVLNNYLGEIDKSFSEGELKIARAKEFYDLAKEKYNLPEEFIGETYAEINFITKKNVPVSIIVGKYSADTATQKNLIIKGTKGKVDLNMHDNFIHIYQGYRIIDRIELVNPKRSRYYPVIKTGLEYFKGKNPYSIDLFSTQINSQEFSLNILEKSRKNPIKLYQTGELHSNIFIKR